jgi:hypothetical protein
MAELVGWTLTWDEDAKLFADAAFPNTSIVLLKVGRETSGNLVFAIVEDNGFVNLCFQIFPHLLFHFANNPADAPIILLSLLGFRDLNFTKVFEIVKKTHIILKVLIVKICIKFLLKIW